MTQSDDIEAALRRSEQHLAAAQRITHCGSWELDLADLSDINRNRLRWSDEVFRIFGYEPGEIEVTNENFFRAVHPDDRERIGVAVRTALDNGTPYSIDHRVIRPDGSVRIVHEQSEIQYDDAGRPLRMIGTVQDVTDQRATEAQLAFSDRMASVGALAAGVAHEINNPLVAVCANLDLMTTMLAALAQRVELPPALEGYLRDARDGSWRVQAIVRDLMMLSRADAADRVPVDVVAVVESALRISAFEIKHRARVIRECQDVPLVDASEARLGQVFVNLIRNAAHAIGEGGVEQHYIRLRTCTDERGRVVVGIADSGCGIPPALQSRVFAPFFTTKPTGEGIGLGLSICQRIVTDLGGEISFTSEVGRGTEFVVALPAAASQRVTPARPQPSRPGRRASPCRVLIVDDEPLVTRALHDLFADEYEVTVINDPVAARDEIAKAGSYDVILCDLMMPRLTGMELHAELSKTAPDLARRMIIMTGGAASREARDFLLSSGVTSIRKPFELDELRRAIDALAS